jgi:DNA-binding MarR family transcriptional regulator
MEQLSLDAYVVDVLMRDLVGHDKKPSAFLVYLCLWRRTSGRGLRAAHLSLQMLVDATGLSKSAVQEALRVLSRRGLIRAERSSPTATPSYTVLRPWSR